ncbi:MAG: phosphoglycerate kinase [Candidatus Latescibacterota bacterium]|nr:phosphoglycerate kinase [Candidatus Latescibacterota bacterium]MEC8646298.1 phosphoglycerate kinase [Candidatus Latescibacterota bacterium]MEE2627128.1 phosphoglycerate kinase [Candidatus Latescibacterota bacterium]MEE2727630.1 phosphoglycerate kinase [Candidatus Latescibacterota bacterium]
MAKKTLSDIDVSGKRALVRVDFNVPLSEDQKITDDTRIRAAVPTIQYLLEGGASVVLMSHLGRPKGRVVPEMSLAPTAVRLGELLNLEVGLAPDCVGSIVEEQAAALEPGQVMLLENLRYKPEEEANDPDFAKALAGLGDLYVNDAFGAAHRGHASTEGIAHHVPEAVSGLLMEREITYLDETLRQPARPFVAILGGAKISGKIEVIENLLDKVDALIVGGGMSYTFFKAMGLEIGVSLLEEDRIGVAKDLIARCFEQDVELLLPIDVIVADRFAVDARTQVVNRDAMPEEWEGVDIGPATRALYSERVKGAGTVVWNGPLGVFEMEPFAQGTLGVAQALVEATEGGTISIIGGGDTAAAVTQMGLADGMTHISTGGGASLECMGGRILPGIVALSDKEDA